MSSPDLAPTPEAGAVLAFESSANRCEVALIYRAHLTSLGETNPRGHASRLLPMADELIRAAGLHSVSDIDLLAFDAGPGGFTGLRIAAAFVQGLAYAGGQAVVGISSLEALAWQSMHGIPALTVGQRVACVIDARMAEVYWQVFEISLGKTSAGNECIAVSEARLGAPELCLEQCRREDVKAIVGDFFAPEAIGDCAAICFRDQPEASTIARLAELRGSKQSLPLPQAAVPRYLRGASAWKKTVHKA